MCFFSVSGKNLAPEGTAYLSRSRQRNNPTKVIDGNTSKRYSFHTCLKATWTKRKTWWRVDFDKLIVVYAVEITPGKLIFCKKGNISGVDVNKECR